MIGCVGRDNKVGNLRDLVLAIQSAENEDVETEKIEKEAEIVEKVEKIKKPEKKEKIEPQKKVKLSKKEPVVIEARKTRNKKIV